MRTESGYTAVVVAVVLVTVGGFVAPALGATAGPVGGTGGGSTGATAQVAQQQASGACNYTQLYDRTIDSVVSVQRGGGQGSGFVYGANESGAGSYVVTNAHVVGDAPNVTIQFTRGESRTGTVVGTDVSSDLAVVRVTETPDYVEGLPVSSEQPRHGQRVAALGSPFGLEETITHGIISGLNRSMPTDRGYTIPNVVQTDAPISSGNSGGPLVTCDGEVVGVNSAGIAAQTAENIGFAISPTTVQRVVPSLIETGEFATPTLGVSATSVTPAVAQANDLNVSQGVIVATVDEGAPAAEVLQGSDRLARVDGQLVPVGGDVIVAVEGQPIATTEDLASVLLTETRPGEQVNLTVVRDGQRTNVTTTVTERPEPEPATPAPRR